MANLRLAWLVPVCAILSAPLACPAPSAPAGPISPFDDGVLSDLPCANARVVPPEPDLLALDPTSRATLDAARREGVVVVRYGGKGCDLRLDVLPSCTLPGSYTFTPYASVETKVAHTLGELYTDFPLGAGRLSGRLKHSPALRADVMLAGIHALKLAGPVHAGDLKGECAGATHVVSKVFAGAFALAVGDPHELEARPSLLGGAASAGTIAREGNARACEAAQEKGVESPACDVPLRLGLVPLAAGSCEAEDGGCPPPTPKDAGSADAAPRADGGVPLNGMVHLAGGTFTMGARSRVPVANDPSVRKVTVAPFDIDANEVTVASYKNCVDEGLCEPPPADQTSCNYGHFERANHPMNCVSYSEANAYCHTVNKRLPTEEEWEFAARGGPEERTYPWGSAEPSKQLCWSGLAKLDGTCPVRSFEPGAFGIYDMSGDVSEWTSSSLSPDRRDTRVCRGGGWPDARALDFRGAYRVAHGPANRDSDLGFRCVRGP